MQKFAYRTHAPVAEVVDVVHRAYAVVQVEVERNRCDYIVHGYVLVVEFVKREFNVFLLLGGEFFYGFALENIEQRAAGEYESSAEFHSLFGSSSATPDSST